MRHLSPVEPAEAGFLCRQGGATEMLLFIGRGTVSVLVDRPPNADPGHRDTGRRAKPTTTASAVRPGSYLLPIHFA